MEHLLDILKGTASDLLSQAVLAIPAAITFLWLKIRKKSTSVKATLKPAKPYGGGEPRPLHPTPMKINVTLKPVRMYGGGHFEPR